MSGRGLGALAVIRGVAMFGHSPGECDHDDDRLERAIDDVESLVDAYAAYFPKFATGTVAPLSEDGKRFLDAYQRCKGHSHA